MLSKASTIVNCFLLKNYMKTLLLFFQEPNYPDQLFSKWRHRSRDSLGALRSICSRERGTFKWKKGLVSISQSFHTSVAWWTLDNSVQGRKRLPDLMQGILLAFSEFTSRLTKIQTSLFVYIWGLFSQLSDYFSTLTTEIPPTKTPSLKKKKKN